MADSIAGAILQVLAIGVHSGSIDFTLQAWFNILLWQPLTLHIGLVPEVGEEHEEERSIHPDEVEEQGDLIVTAFHEVPLGSMK